LNDFHATAADDMTMCRAATGVNACNDDPSRLAMNAGACDKPAARRGVAQRRGE
jgi:hypothetical protein